MDSPLRPACPKCAGNVFRFSFVFADHKVKTFGGSQEELARNQEQHEAAMLDVLSKADAERDKLSQSYKAKRHELLCARERAEMQWRYDLEQAKEVARAQLEADTELALLTNEDDLASLARGRVGTLDYYVEKADRRIAALDKRYESLVAEVSRSSEQRWREIYQQQRNEHRDFGSRVENDSVAIVYCGKCGHVVGACLNPMGTRFTDTCETLNALTCSIEKTHSELLGVIRELANSIQALSQFVAEEQMCIQNGFNMLAQILAAPTRTTSVGIEF